MDSLISIIVPIFNVDRYLDECIYSIVNQTYKNLEIILVNDGSTDESGKICSDWEKKDIRVKVIHQENQGVAEARNKGLDIAKGDYIGFIDPDDYIHSRMYEFLYNAMIDQDGDIAICQEEAFEDGKDPVKLDLEEYHFDTVVSKIDVYQKLISFYPSSITFVWKKLYKKEIIENRRFQKGKLIEDAFFAVDVLPYARKIIQISDRLYYYRLRNNSISHAPNLKTYEDLSEAIEYQTKMMIQQGDRSLTESSAAFFLNKLALLETKAYYGEDKVSQKFLRKLFLEKYKQYIGYIKNQKILLKLVLAKYFSGIYHKLKKRQVTYRSH